MPHCGMPSAMRGAATLLLRRMVVDVFMRSMSSTLSAKRPREHRPCAGRRLGMSNLLLRPRHVAFQQKPCSEAAEDPAEDV